MKKILFIAFGCICALTINSYGQQDSLHRKQPLTAEQLQQRRQIHEQKADSAISNREVQRMKELVTLTREQEVALYQAGITISHERREVFKKYWKTEAFQQQMAVVDKRADSLYQSVVGATNLKSYKEMLRTSMVRKQQIMQQRATADSLNRKIQQP